MKYNNNLFKVININFYNLFYLTKLKNIIRILNN